MDGVGFGVEAHAASHARDLVVADHLRHLDRGNVQRMRQRVAEGTVPFQSLSKSAGS